MRISTLLKPLALSLTLLFPAFADVTVGNLKLTNYWVRPGVITKNTGAYVTIQNLSDQKYQLLKAECADTGFTELHDHINEEGVMKMRPVKAIAINENSVVELKRGSLHIMLMNLKKDLKEGETIKMRLVFKKEGTQETAEETVDLDFPVTANQPGPVPLPK